MKALLRARHAARVSSLGAGLALAATAALASCNALVGGPDAASSPADASDDVGDAIASQPLDARSDAPNTPIDAAPDAPADALAPDVSVPGDEGGLPSKNGCAEGYCEIVVPSNARYQGIYKLAVLGNRLFFTNWCTPPSALYRTNITGSDVVTQIGASGCGGSLMLDGNSVFYANVRDPLHDQTDVVTFAADTTVITPVLSIPEWGWAVAVDPQYVFYARGDRGDNGIARRDRLPEGTPPQPAKAGTPITAHKADSLVLWGAQVFYAGGSEIRVINKDGTNDRLLYDMSSLVEYDARNLRTDGTFLYWVENDRWARGSIYRGAMDGASYAPLVIDDGDSHQALAVDDTSVYFHNGQAVFRVPKGGGTPQLLARWSTTIDGDIVTSLAVDDGYVYWGRGTNVGSSIWRTPK